MATCFSCEFLLEEDFGYSNYTVEGTVCSCLLNKNPNLPRDRFYREEQELFQACDSYRKGSSTQLDVESGVDYINNHMDLVELVEYYASCEEVEPILYNWFKESNYPDFNEARKQLRKKANIE